MGIKDKEWEKIFQSLNILQEIKAKGEFNITSKDLKEVGKIHHISIEPRLMIKHDTSKQRPKIMADNNLSILSLTNTEWKIAPFDAYYKVEDKVSDYIFHRFLNTFETFSIDSLNNETTQLNYAFISGILNDFVEDILIETTSGKRRVSEFEYDINNVNHTGTIHMKVKGAQAEIDKVYEGNNAIYVVEAKQAEYPDFLIRQLYYPYRDIKSSTRVTKPVIPIHIIYDSNLYLFEKYEFVDEKNYNSLKLQKQLAVKISEEHTKDELCQIIQSTRVRREPSITFPQANNVVLFVRLLKFLKKSKTAKEIAEYIHYDVRQGAYYGTALLYLNFAKKENDKYKAKTCDEIDFEMRFAKALASLPIFRAILEESIKANELISSERIEAIIFSNRKDITDNTISRRANCAYKWCEYVLRAFGYV